MLRIRSSSITYQELINATQTPERGSGREGFGEPAAGWWRPVRLAEGGAQRAGSTEPFGAAVRAAARPQGHEGGGGAAAHQVVKRDLMQPLVRVLPLPANKLKIKN